MVAYGHRSLAALARLSAFVLLACAPPSQTETVASPVVGAVRRAEGAQGEAGAMYEQRGADGTVVSHVTAPPAAVWQALVASFSARKIATPILDPAVGRLGDTALVIMHRWNGQQPSRYLSCGSTMTGPRADEERIRGVLLAQLTKLAGDTVAVAVHFSGGAYPVASGNSSMSVQCTSTGRVEREILDDVARRATAR